MERAVTLELKPHPKERPRTGKNGHTYTPTKTKDAEKAIRDGWLKAYPADECPPFEGPIGVLLGFKQDAVCVWIHELTDENASKLRGDLDNYVKTVLDALNKVAYKDDKQILSLSAAKS